jgi:hypothetical protein
MLSVVVLRLFTLIVVKPNVVLLNVVALFKVAHSSVGHYQKLFFFEIFFQKTWKDPSVIKLFTAVMYAIVSLTSVKIVAIYFNIDQNILYLWLVG